MGGALTLRLYDIDKKGDRRKAEEIVHNMVDSAIEMDGTCTGGKTPYLNRWLIAEHGIGMVKKHYLVQELGLETVETMLRIKVSPYLPDIFALFFRLGADRI